MKILKTIFVSSLVGLLILGFISFILVDNLLATHSYYLQLKSVLELIILSLTGIIGLSLGGIIITIIWEKIKNK